MPFVQLFLSTDQSSPTVLGGDCAAGVACDLAGALGLMPDQVLVQLFFANAGSLPSVVGVVRSSARPQMATAVESLRPALANRFGIPEEAVLVSFEEIRRLPEPGDAAAGDG